MVVKLHKLLQYVSLSTLMSQRRDDRFSQELGQDHTTATMNDTARSPYNINGSKATAVSVAELEIEDIEHFILARCPQMLTI